jgi:hypothetical protein
MRSQSLLCLAAFASSALGAAGNNPPVEGVHTTESKSNIKSVSTTAKATSTPVITAAITAVITPAVTAVTVTAAIAAVTTARVNFGYEVYQGNLNTTGNYYVFSNVFYA